MGEGKAAIIPLHLHPEFQDRHRLNELKQALLAETLAFAQVALDNADSPRAAKILTRACQLMTEARDRLVLELV